MTFRFLMSFHYGRGKDLQTIADAASGLPVEVFADSGAFSAATLGTTIRLADYAAWLKDWQGLITTAATLDVIGDPDATHRNTLALEDMGLRVLPVFHTGSPWDRLEKLCARYPYVALGGMVPYARMYGEVMRWLVRCFRIGAEHGTVFHGFGQTNVTAMASLPFYSVDSSTWSLGARFGSLRLWDERSACIRQLYVGRPSEARKNARLLRAYGVDPDDIARPGFALKAGKTSEQFYREDRTLRGTPAVTFHRLGQWLQHRHDVAPPPGWTSRGTCLFLADTSTANFTPAAEAIATDLRKDTP
ncbi:hypothetical protein ABTY20_18875 [Streptomyces sp. NPDC126497]|uniref:hypothetical protein n=1 Tax=Streptomyces sp. NPDC126497 TaxID=3155313 RepID=UPI003326E65C